MIRTYRSIRDRERGAMRERERESVRVLDFFTQKK